MEIDFKRSIEQLERILIERAMRECCGQLDQAARYLGLAPSTLYDRLRRYGWIKRVTWWDMGDVIERKYE